MEEAAIFIVNKHVGPTSFEIVREIKKISGGMKVGHGGSLDPFATGVLIILLGKATKLSSFLLNADKKYSGVIRLGEQTDTLDPTGKIIKTKTTLPPLKEEVDRVFHSFLGTWHQTIPMYSAKKIHGVRSYELARQDIYVRRDREAVNVYSCQATKYEFPWIHFEIHCSKGTYVRSFAEEVGEKLGTVAHLYELNRLACGNFVIANSVSLEEIQRNFLVCWEIGKKNYSQVLINENSYFAKGNIEREFAKSIYQ